MVSRLLNRFVTTLLRALVFSYRYFLSPLLHLIAGSGFGCRFEPTCGHFAKEALEEHGPARGSFLAIRRVCRCHPFTRGGYDPVPPGATKRR